eukprot:m.45291 g.45291  ORF g.45291 m.45291 type:complete len:314 (+) comp6631_c0_seq1:1766-2707(+)
MSCESSPRRLEKRKTLSNCRFSICLPNCTSPTRSKPNSCSSTCLIWPSTISTTISVTERGMCAPCCTSRTQSFTNTPSISSSIPNRHPSFSLCTTLITGSHPAPCRTCSMRKCLDTFPCPSGRRNRLTQNSATMRRRSTKAFPHQIHSRLVTFAPRHRCLPVAVAWISFTFTVTMNLMTLTTATTLMILMMTAMMTVRMIPMRGMMPRVATVTTVTTATTATKMTMMKRCRNMEGRPPKSLMMMMMIPRMDRDRMIRTIRTKVCNFRWCHGPLGSTRGRRLSVVCIGIVQGLRCSLYQGTRYAYRMHSRCGVP